VIGKRRVIHTLGFTKGFPETSVDFALYAAQIAQFNSVSTGMLLTRLNEIKNHNLQQLLQYSGAESRIVSSHYIPWLIVKGWTPNDRYRIRHYSRSKAKAFLTAAFILLKQLDN
jgi:hypothetical protein